MFLHYVLQNIKNYSLLMFVKGDSGAPLLQIMTDNRVTHLGISSFVSGNGCENPEPAGYTRTYSYVDWIKSVTDITT